MARVRKIERGRQDVRVHRTQVDCFHQVAVASDQTRYLHLSTYAAEDGGTTSKSGQSLQLDEDTARELVAVIRKTFPDID